MSNQRYLIYAFACIFIAGLRQSAQAQQELMLSTQSNLIHSGLVNPAVFPDGKKFYLGLPGLAFDAWHSGNVNYRDVFEKNGDKRTLNLDNLIAKLEDQNDLIIDQRTETFAFGFKAGKHLFFMGHHAIRLIGDIEYPKTAAQLLWQGNGQFIGQTVEVNPSIAMSGLNEIGIGAGFMQGPLSVSVRGKYLSGMGMVKSDRFNASVYTNPDIYQLTLTSDISLVSSGLITQIDTTANGFDFQFGTFDRKNLFSNNTGAAFDLGITYKVSEKLQIGASALDLGGSINWKEDVKQFDSRGTFQYDGAVFDGNSLVNESGDIDIDTQLDTLKQIFQFTESTTTFKQKLPSRYYANATYRYSDKWTFGAALSGLKGPSTDLRYGLGVSATWHPIKWVSLGSMYSINDHSVVNIGGLLDIKLGPVRAYMTADNLFAAFAPRAVANVNMRYGFGLVF